MSGIQVCWSAHGLPLRPRSSARKAHKPKDDVVAGDTQYGMPRRRKASAAATPLQVTWHGVVRMTSFFYTESTTRGNHSRRRRYPSRQKNPQKRSLNSPSFPCVPLLNVKENPIQNTPRLKSVPSRSHECTSFSHAQSGLKPNRFPIGSGLIPFPSLPLFSKPCRDTSLCV